MGRGHLVFYMTLKLSHWCEPPWLLYGMAHRDPEKARAAHLRLLASQCPHPRVQALKVEPLASQGQLWQDEGWDLSEGSLSDLCMFIAELKWAWTAERAVEGEHRRIKQRGSSAQNHSEPYISFGLRKRELIKLLDKDPAALDALAGSGFVSFQCATPPACRARVPTGPVSSRCGVGLGPGGASQGSRRRGSQAGCRELK